MRLLVDENLAGRELISRLERSGHELADACLGWSDEDLWDAAQVARAAVVALNVKDFVRLAAQTPDHCGLLLVFRTNDRSSDMRATDIAAAIDRVADYHPDGLVGRVVVLNGYPG